MLNNLMSRNFLNLSRQCMRQYATGSGGKRSSTLPPKLANLQKQFQKKSDLPVFLRGGQKDLILYYSTLGLAGLGLIFDFVFYAGFMWP